MRVQGLITSLVLIFICPPRNPTKGECLLLLITRLHSRRVDVDQLNPTAYKNNHFPLTSPNHPTSTYREKGERTVGTHTSSWCSPRSTSTKAACHLPYWGALHGMAGSQKTSGVDLGGALFERALSSLPMHDQPPHDHLFASKPSRSECLALQH